MWFQASAAQGNRRAMSCLSNIYSRGYGVKKDLKRAFELLEAPADLGDPWALCMLGWYAESGIIGNQDYEKAVTLYEQAIHAGDPHAHNNLGRLYWNGRGVIKNRRYGKKLIVKAAELGDEDAIALVGSMAKKNDPDWNRDD